MADDPNLITAALPVFQALAPKFLSSISSKAGQSVDKVRARLKSTFSSHLETTFERCASVKTIFSEDQPVPLSSIYVSLYLKSGKNIVKDEDLLHVSSNFQRVAIVGTGGAGKTMIMKHLALSYYHNPTGQIPLFIELRSLERHSIEDFYKALFAVVTPEKDADSFSLFLEGLRAGIFTLFLDGLDEISPDFREQVYRSIQRIPTDFPTTKVVASTRPEIDVSTWEQFSDYHVQNLNKDQVRQLVSKVSYPEEIKERFLRRVNDGLYEEYKTFMGVPLLCSLMLLTFSEYSDVPSRVTVFYEQAFETLFRRHDRSKGFFKRQHLSNLSSDRFRVLFSAFCYRTLARHSLSFTDSELRDHIIAAARVCEIDVNADNFAYDLVSSVCMVMRDGLKLHFIHRSFQDYFAALYMLRCRGPQTFDVFDQVLTDMIVSNVADMAADIDLQTLEREWVLPSITKVEKKLRSWRATNLTYNLLNATFFELKVDIKRSLYVSGWSWSRDQSFMPIITTLAKIYPEKVIQLAREYLQASGR